MKTLTEKQRNILEFIEEFLDREGMAPTVYEIADHFGIKTSTVFAHLRALQRKKQLSRSSKARSRRTPCLDTACIERSSGVLASSASPL